MLLGWKGGSEMRRALKATICNEAHPEYGAVSLPFPIKLEEYDENLKMLDALGIGDPIEQDCFVDEIESPHLILERLKGNRINLDELDFLAKQLNRFSEREMVDFEGSVLLQKATELPELINIALSCSNTIIHQRFRELAHIGQKILAAQNDRDVTFGQAESATPVQAALDALSHGAGTVTPYGVVFENGMGIRLQYDGQVFPDCDCESPLAVIQVPLKHEWELRQLFLPMPEKRLERELIRLGYEEGNAYWIFSSKGALFEKLDIRLDTGRETVCDLNRLCLAVRNFTDEDFSILKETAAALGAISSIHLRILAGALKQAGNNISVEPDEVSPQMGGIS